MNSPTHKKRRMELQKMRTALRQRKENVEGTTYESNCSLLLEPAIQFDDDRLDSEEVVDEISQIPIVLLDLETSGFDKNSCILQIGAKCGKKCFETYVNPIRPIASAVTTVNGLMNIHGDLFYNGIKVSSIPLRAAIGEFLNWLMLIGKKCCIATHNLGFDGPRLLTAINQFSLKPEFSAVVDGFVDTLRVISNITGRKTKGQCTITGLAEHYSIVTTGAHNAMHDCVILDKILKNVKSPIVY